MRLLDALLPRREVARYVPPPWMDLFPAPILPGYTTSYGTDKAEPIGDTFVDYVLGGLQGNGVIWSIERVRLSVFSECRFQFQRIRKGRPADLFGMPELALLERPWTGGTTGDLLTRMILDADMAGNFFAVEIDGEVARMRPDWVEVVLTERYDVEGRQVGWKRLGYLYYEGGKNGQIPAVFLPGEVVHFAPMPDPLANYRGMSWLTPMVREIMADTQATKHKLKFFEHAAAQPYDAGVLTPTGWTRMEDVTVGSQVMGPDGKPRTVLGVYPQGEKDIYRLTFEGGATTECCEDHVWRVSNLYDRRRGTYRLMTLREIIDNGVVYPSGPAKWAIPLTDPIEYTVCQPLPLDPYLLGLLLGDGSFRGNGKGSGGVSLAVSASDADETAGTLRPLLPDGVTISRRDRGGWSEFYFKGPGGPKENPLTRTVRDLGLFDVGGRDKTVPEAYMRASVANRILLLQGLIDSDGSVNRSKEASTGVRFSSTSEVLAQQVRELAQSLGGTASCLPEGRNGTAGRRPQWCVRINRLPDWIVPVRLSRKVADYRSFGGSGAHRGQTLKKVEFVRREHAQCIKVDAEDGLYVTDNFIVTHNTPNLAVSLPKELSPDQFAAFVEKMDATHKGVDNAYKTLYTGGGADVTVVGADMRQLDFKVTQGAGESRLAAAGGIHPAIVGLSEGLQGSSLNAGNFGAARRLVADGTMRPLWRNAAGSLEVLAPPPDGARLWYDARDVAFLREDARDEAEIMQIDGQTVVSLVRDGGFTSDSAKAAVQARNVDLLVPDPDWISVQLQEKRRQAALAPANEDNSEAAKGSEP